MPAGGILGKMFTAGCRNQAELRYSEIDDGDEVIENFFNSIDLDNDGKLSWSEVKTALGAFESGSSLKLTDLLKNMEAELRGNTSAIYGRDEDLNLSKFKEMVKKVPRIHGQRFQWVQSLNLNKILTRKLKLGNLFDELSGVRDMTEADIDTALNSFLKDVESVVKCEWSLLKKSCTNLFTGLEKVEEAMSKYAGTVGTFGDTQMFQEGLENQVGSPDPFILTGIFRENILSAQSMERSVTSNYKIVFSSMQEFARIFGNPLEYERGPLTILEEKDVYDDIPIFLIEVAKGLHPGIKGPKEAELKDLDTAFRDLRKLYGEICARNQGLFPGDIGNVQQSMEIKFEAPDKESAQECHAKLVEFVNQHEERSFCVDPGQVPSNNCFRVTVFGVLAFFDSSKDQTFMELLESSNPSVRIQKLSESHRTFIYCKLEHGKPTNLLEVLKCLDLSELRRISALEESASREVHIDFIAGQAQASSKIVCMQGRRHLSLRQLMDLQEIKEAGLRVEEAIQVYQYTGPLFQVNVHSYSVLS